MTYSPNLVTRGAAHSKATAAAAKAYIHAHDPYHPDDCDLLVEAFAERCPLMGIRFEVPFGQFCDETACGADDGYWLKNRNPGGLRVTYPGEPSRTWANGRDAALGMLHRLSLYVFGFVHPAIADGAPHDPLPEEVGKAGYLGIADQLADLAGHWAANTNYANQISDHLNLAFPKGDDTSDAFTLPAEGGTTVYPTTPDVRKPKIRDLRTDYAHYGLSLSEANEILSHRFVGRNGGRPLAEYGHVQDGKTRGSLQYWADPDVQASAHYMVEENGDACRVINDEDGAWTNGDVNQPLEEIRYLLSLGGNLNNWTLTIEADGDASNVLTAEERLTIIWIMETWAIKYPEIMVNLVNRTHGHYTANSVSRAFCGRYVPSIDEHLKAWVAGAGTQIPDRPEEEPISLYPAGLTPQMAKRLYEEKGALTFPWTSKEIGFDDTRSEVQTWLVRGAASIPEGGDWTQGTWPYLVDVIRRGKSNNVHVYQYSNGDVYEKLVRKD